MPVASEQVGVTQILGRLDLPLQRVHSPIVGYALAFVCVAIALGLALILQQYEFREVGLPVLSLAVGIATWFGGVGPAVLAVMLSGTCFNYFFTEPIHSFEINAR